MEQGPAHVGRPRVEVPVGAEGDARLQDVLPRGVAAVLDQRRAQVGVRPGDVLLQVVGEGGVEALLQDGLRPASSPAIISAVPTLFSAWTSVSTSPNARASSTARFPHSCAPSVSSASIRSWAMLL